MTSIETHPPVQHGLPMHVAARSTRAVGLLILAALVVVVALLSLRIGSLEISTADAVTALTDYQPDSYEQTVVRSLRLPRTLIGLGVGAALAVAVAAAGPVGFVAFMVPHVVRMLAGAMPGGVLLLTGMLGGLLLLGADLLGQFALPRPTVTRICESVHRHPADLSKS
jgi:ABC-type enterobactin transport system permease subunit